MGGHASRDVRARSLGDGTAEIWARLLDVDAFAVVVALRAGSALSRAAGDPRTLAQLRADGLTAAVTGHPWIYGVSSDVPDHAAGRASGRATIAVVVPWTTLTGAGHEPWEVAGLGPFPEGLSATLVPWPDGPTTLPDAMMLCRYHHRLKTHAAGWDIDGSGDDDVVWTSPAGRRSRTRPAAHPVGPAATAASDPTGPQHDPPPF